jgi:LSD1 subclass zinc finger protein
LSWQWGWYRTMPSMIAKELLEILVCPACKQALEYRTNPESLKCTQCHRVYAVKDDIPIMLIDEARIESA